MAGAAACAAIVTVKLNPSTEHPVFSVSVMGIKAAVPGAALTALVETVPPTVAQFDCACPRELIHTIESKVTHENKRLNIALARSCPIMGTNSSYL
jgi:hypothetical protein